MHVDTVAIAMHATQINKVDWVLCAEMTCVSIECVMLFVFFIFHSVASADWLSRYCTCMVRW